MVYKKYDHLAKLYIKDETGELPKVENATEALFEYNAEDKDKVKCLCCQTERSYKEFPRAFDPFVSIRVKLPGTNEYYVTGICYHCIGRLINYFITEYNFSAVDGLKCVCAMFNLYFNRTAAEQILNDKSKMFDNGEPIPISYPWYVLYFDLINNDESFNMLHYWSTITPEQEEQIKHELSNDFGFEEGFEIIDEEKAAKLKKDEEKNNFNTIWNLYHYDPFENEPAADKPKLMTDLVTMIDDAMAGDFVRMRAALEIVRSYHRIDKLAETITDLQSSTEKTVENAKKLKDLIDTKKKETDMVTAFSKDHGFAEKYAMSKTKGTGTLGGIVRDMQEGHFDVGTVNFYDIKTSKAIQQVSDISAESIFKQLNLVDSDFAQMVKTQAGEMAELKEENDRLREELRVWKEKHLKQDLLLELKADLLKKNISTENVDEILNQEVHIK